MKKLILSLAGLGLGTMAYAGTTTAALTVAASLASTCAINFSAGTSTLTALVSGASSTSAATFNINCTPGISTLALGAVSGNGWRIKGGTSSDYISYTITMPTALTGYASTWSGSAGSTTSVAVVTTTTQPTFTGTSVAIPLTIATQTVPATSSTGSYTDTVTMTATF
jgi:hypothetical protein